jgi:RNA polymerase-interacting CarD/CdnL/TRCF family regulator
MSEVVALNVMLSILSDEKFLKNITKVLEKYKEVKDVYPIRVDDANLNAFAEGNKAEISKLIQELERTLGVKKVEAKILNPV